ncbi:MAG TPA: amino acid adenylation domain-containing protein, partial [Thermoanaerobaculia bacterium]
RSAAVARALGRAGVRRGDRVAVLVPRDERLPAALLGAMAAGAAYVPLDPAHPPARRALVLRDAGVRLLLVDGAPPAEAGELPALAIDDALAAAGEDGFVAPPDGPDGDDLAYVLYTSGSTGTPKGVMVTHRGLANYLDWAVRFYRLAEGGGALVHSPIGFDLTVTSLFAPLLAGRPIEMVAAGPGIEPLCAALERHRDPGLLKVTPAHLDLLRGALGEERLAALARVLVVGGDGLFDAQVRPWRRAAPATRVINEYGPTETVVGCVVHEVEAEPPAGAVAIGRPIDNTRAYVLDATLRLVPGGLPGELFLAGAGVARGYLGRPALTAERFLPDPFAATPGERMYRSGDVVRQRADGALVYLGRGDRQAKVRGHRVEPGEVEAALRRLPGVREAAALVRGDGGEAALVAWVVLDPPAADADGEAAVLDGLRRGLAAALPEAMVPAALVALPEMPLTGNGKVDLARLPAPGPARQPGERPVLPPRDVAELRLVALWEELLEVSPVGVEDDFFDLGGHSLLAERMLTRMRRELGATVALSRFLERPTVRALAAAAAAGPQPPLTPLVTLRRRGERPPVFCVHPLGGDVLCFHDLARRLGAEQPFHAFRAPHPSELHGPGRSIEEMAEEYVGELERAAPAGPVVVAGFSYGSIVAFEMACRMARRGRPPALLALLDGRAPASLRQAAGRSDALLLAGLARDLARESGVELALPHAEVAALAADEALPWILDRLRQAGLVTPDLDLGWIERFLAGVRARLEAVYRYRPAVYPGAIDLFRSTAVDEESARAWAEHGVDLADHDKGWGELCEQRLRVHRVPGHHARIVQEPHVGALADALTAAVDAATDPQSRR